MVTEKIISELPLASVSKRVFVQNHSYENIFYLPAHFHLKSFAQELVLKEREKTTRKLPILYLN